MSLCALPPSNGCLVAYLCISQRGSLSHSEALGSCTLGRLSLPIEEEAELASSIIRLHQQTEPAKLHLAIAYLLLVSAYGFTHL